MNTTLRRIALPLLLSAALISPLAAQPAKKGTVLQALELEIARAGRVLGEKGDPAPYFIGYSVADAQTTSIAASLGALRSSSSDRSRQLDVAVRVGDYQLDNTHKLRGDRDFLAFFDNLSVALPIEDDIDALRSRIWIETDKRYKSAVEKLIRVKANRAVKVAEEDSSADFSKEKPVTSVLPEARLAIDVADWQSKVKKYSEYFRQYPELHDGSVTFQSQAETFYLASTEGSSIQHGRTHARLILVARTRADDGMELFRHEIFDAHSLDKLPDEGRLRLAIDSIVSDLRALRMAPVIEPYTGPAILTGRAAGVFFHEIFGHRIEGHRQKDEEEGQTFTRKVGDEILPAFMSVHDNPTLKEIDGIDLNGYYLYDDEGVPAQDVTVVDNGVLRNFLMSRTPVAGFDNSNGHGRKQPGRAAVGRQGNLIVRSSSPVSDARLREMLVEECKRQKKPFGLLFADISGGFTFTGRGIPQAFQVTPVIVYRIYADGRQELVRGVDLIGTPLTSFSRIIAASDRLEVFNGVCGAESGWVPVSGVAPGILTTQIEIQKKYKESDRPPVLPPPAGDNPQ